MSGEREVRTFSVDSIRVEGDAKQKIKGHAAAFNSMSRDLGGFYEVIAPGAFSKSLANADVRALFNHDPNIILGRNKSGTLTLSEDDTGLYFEIDPPDTQLIRDMVMSPIARGDVSQCSFGFRTVTDRWEKRDGKTVRTLVEVEIFDVSPVVYPAYDSTDVAVRSMPKTFEAESNWQNEIRQKMLDLIA